MGVGGYVSAWVPPSAAILLQAARTSAELEPLSLNTCPRASNDRYQNYYYECVGGWIYTTILSMLLYGSVEMFSAPDGKNTVL